MAFDAQVAHLIDDILRNGDDFLVVYFLEDVAAEGDGIAQGGVLPLRDVDVDGMGVVVLQQERKAVLVLDYPAVDVSQFFVVAVLEFSGVEEDGDFSGEVAEGVDDLDAMRSACLEVGEYSFEGYLGQLEEGAILVDALVGGAVDDTGDDGLAGGILEEEFIVDGDDIEEGVAVGGNFNGVGEVFADGDQVGVVVLLGFVDDLHAHAVDSAGEGVGGDEDGEGQILGESDRAGHGGDCQHVGHVVVGLYVTFVADLPCDLVEVHSDFLDIGVGVDVLVDDQLFFQHFLLERSAFSQVHNLVLV
jgi:hypothetical protein